MMRSGLTLLLVIFWLSSAGQQEPRLSNAYHYTVKAGFPFRTRVFSHVLKLKDDNTFIYSYRGGRDCSTFDFDEAGTWTRDGDQLILVFDNKSSGMLAENYIIERRRIRPLTHSDSTDTSRLFAEGDKWIAKKIN